MKKTLKQLIQPLHQLWSNKSPKETRKIKWISHPNFRKSHIKAVHENVAAYTVPKKLKKLKKVENFRKSHIKVVHENEAAYSVAKKAEKKLNKKTVHENLSPNHPSKLPIFLIVRNSSHLQRSRKKNIQWMWKKEHIHIHIFAVHEKLNPILSLVSIFSSA